MPLSERGQALQPARLQGRVDMLHMPARTTPSSGVTLAPLGADLPASGLSGLSQRDGPLDD